MKRLFFATAALVAATVIVSCSPNTTPKSDAPRDNPVPANESASTAPVDDAAAPVANVAPVTTAGPVGGRPVADSSDATTPAPAAGPLEGLVLIAPLRSTETYLVNMDKQIVHRWKSDYPPAASVYLMENGDLLRCAKDPAFTHFHGGGIGGILERYNWEGQLIWSFKYADEAHCAHHDIAPLPNGNILMIAWERKSKDEAIAQGRDPKLLKEDLWPDHVIEVQPDGPTGGKIVWEWHMWDHLVQDFDREKPNFGVVY